MDVAVVLVVVKDMVVIGKQQQKKRNGVLRVVTPKVYYGKKLNGLKMSRC